MTTLENLVPPQKEGSLSGKNDSIFSTCDSTAEEISSCTLNSVSRTGHVNLNSSLTATLNMVVLTDSISEK